MKYINHNIMFLVFAVIVMFQNIIDGIIRFLFFRNKLKEKEIKVILENIHINENLD